MKDKELVQKIKELKSIKPDNQWRENLAKELLFRAKSSFPGITEKPEFLFSFKKVFSFSRLVRVGVSLLIILSIVFGGSIFVVQAAERSIPGDFLYPLKITKEKLHLALISQPEKKVQLILKFADNRLEEAEKLAAKGEDGEKIVQVMDNFQKQIKEAKEHLSKLKPKNDLIKEAGFKVVNYQKVLTRLEKEPFLEEDVKQKIKIALNSSEDLVSPFKLEEKEKQIKEKDGEEEAKTEEDSLSQTKKEEKVKTSQDFHHPAKSSKPLKKKVDSPKIFLPEKKKLSPSGEFSGGIKREKIQFKGLIIREEK